LVILFLYNTIGFIAIHPFILTFVKQLGTHKAENPTKDELIELIVLKKEDILLKKIQYERINSKEFRLNNELYDIVREVEKDSDILLYCINDKREVELEKNFHKKMEENTANKKQRTNYRVSLVKIISEPIAYLALEKQNSTRIMYRTLIDGNYEQVWKDVMTPPPNISLA